MPQELDEWIIGIGAEGSGRRYVVRTAQHLPFYCEIVETKSVPLEKDEEVFAISLGDGRYLSKFLFYGGDHLKDPETRARLEEVQKELVRIATSEIAWRLCGEWVEFRED